MFVWRNELTEESFDRLKERHEALAESLGLLADSHRKTEDVLRRAIRLGVREARAERKRRQEMDARFDEKIGQLAAAQLITEEEAAKANASAAEANASAAKANASVDKLSATVDKLSANVDRFIESLRRGGNGHGS